MTFVIKLLGELLWVSLIHGNSQRVFILGLKSSPMLSELPFTQIPLSDNAFHVFRPLVHTMLVDDNKDSFGKADFLEIQIQWLFKEMILFIESWIVILLKNL